MKFFFPMKTKIVLFFLFLSSIVIGQTKVGGNVTDEFGDPIAFANVIFKNSKEGVITDENGNKAKVTIADVNQSNGVIHVIDAVVTPKA